MKLIVGLGNPGPKYSATKHNVGFMLADLLSSRFRSKFRSGRGNYIYADFMYEGEKLLIVKPLTYMNLSGEAVAHALSYWKIDKGDMLVAVDDLNLPLGTLRARAKGGSGGQKGLDSIIRCLSTENFSRFRVGIHRPEENEKWANYVLTPFSKEETPVIAETIERAGDACLYWVKNGIDLTMSKFNG
ncbi:MAG: aminoacyl-tRNA hydrolase [Candidatus Cloacimonetes bacterium 4572_55]|nr:MAG: aminoacyl-tRNA hydrolase [Candidatus Cloacimonetes bacterium 4572_55]